MDKPSIPDGVISRAVRDGLIKRRQLIDGGMSTEDADRLVGQDLRHAWELSSQRPCDEERGLYLCRQCFDSGWIVVQPTYWEQMRLKRLYGDDPQHQDYMRKCDPCPWLEREREKRRSRDGEAVDGLASAGQMKRGKSHFSQF